MTPSPTVCCQARVHGRVQGVFFRASTARQAQALGLSGHARNLPDGSVEVLCCGSAGAVDALCEWLKQGPPAARVDRLECQFVEIAEAPTGFTTG